MAEMILKKSSLTEFVKSLMSEHEVLGPVKDGQYYKFGPSEDGNFDLDYQNTFLSPKDLFFPQSEKMFEFSTDPDNPEAHVLKEVGLDFPSRVVFGIRPCDAKAFFVLDKIFTNDQYTDPYWVKRREAATLIGLGCNEPCPTCFCTSVGCGPFHEEGLDAIAYDLGDELLIKTLTDKGKNLLEKAKGLSPAPAEAEGRAQEIKTKAEGSITCELATDNIMSRPVLELYEAEHWGRVHESCLNCGTCTYVCPTCHCFDIQDELYGRNGDRVRNWDSCMSWLFTIHGTGHNPRPGKMERVRQRFMHKFKYIPIKRDGEIGCVGCGRCVNLCPVNIDVRDVVRNMNA